MLPVDLKTNDWISASPGTVEPARAMWKRLDRLRAVRGDLLTTAALFVVVAIMLSFMP